MKWGELDAAPEVGTFYGRDPRRVHSAVPTGGDGGGGPWRRSPVSLHVLLGSIQVVISKQSPAVLVVVVAANLEQSWGE